MKRIFALGAALALIGIAAAGCQNTAEGAKEDTAHDAAAVKSAVDTGAINRVVDRMASATEKAAKNVGGNLDARPRVKAAIINDSELNNTGNEVHVDVQGSKLMLTGHVLTVDMKQRAERIARKTLRNMNSSDSVGNKLTVQSRE